MIGTAGYWAAFRQVELGFRLLGLGVGSLGGCNSGTEEEGTLSWRYGWGPEPCFFPAHALQR